MRIGTVDVPRIGPGTNRRRNTAGNAAFIRAAVAAGIRMIDTAHLYTSGERDRALEVWCASVWAAYAHTRGGEAVAGLLARRGIG